MKNNNISKLTLIFLTSTVLLVGTFFYLQDFKQKSENLEYVSIVEREIISGNFDEDNFKTQEEWKKILTKEQYYILQEAGTETPFTGKLNDEKRAGTYYSQGCDKPLFSSEDKYDSKTGWPSFTTPIDQGLVVLRKEKSGDNRIEVLDTCGGHLGHVFDDGPPPTGKRYCMNSIALKFVPDSE